MGGKAQLILVFVVPAVLMLMFFLRRRPAAEPPNRAAVEAIPLSQSVPEEKTPDGVGVEWTPEGFLLRASCGSLVGGAVWAIFAGVLGVIPFRLWGDLIRGVWTDEGVSFWTTIAFLAVWAGAVLYVAAMGSVAAFGEIRIAKVGDSGEIFTGIGKAGWTHRLRWSEFYGASDREASSGSSATSSHTTHYVGLNGTSQSYKFGSELSAEQQAFVIAFLREHVFGVRNPAAGAPPGREGDGKTVSVEHIRQTLEKAKADYSGSDPEGFERAADEFVASLREQYGEQVPTADAVQRVTKFAGDNGGQISFSF